MFKKMIAILALALIGATAHAEDKLELGYRVDNTRNSTEEQNVVTLDWMHKMNKYWSVGLGARLSEKDQPGDKNNHRLTNRFMLRNQFDYNMLYLNVDLGEKNQSLAPSTGFYQVESGVKYKVNDDWQVKLGYQYRNGLAGVDDLQKGPRVAVKYKIDKSLAVNLKYDYFEFANNVKRDRIGVSIEKRFF